VAVEVVGGAEETLHWHGFAAVEGEWLEVGAVEEAVLPFGACEHAAVGELHDAPALVGGQSVGHGVVAGLHGFACRCGVGRGLRGGAAAEEGEQREQQGAVAAKWTHSHKAFRSD